VLVEDQVPADEASQQDVVGVKWSRRGAGMRIKRSRVDNHHELFENLWLMLLEVLGNPDVLQQFRQVALSGGRQLS
jgi:hypothetical protein